MKRKRFAWLRRASTATTMRLGQEAVPVGCCFGLTPADKTMITHRGLGVLLLRGVSFKKVMSGLYGKGASPTRGRIPIYHLAEPEIGVIAGTPWWGL